MRASSEKTGIGPMYFPNPANLEGERREHDREQEGESIAHPSGKRYAHQDEDAEKQRCVNRLTEVR